MPKSLRYGLVILTVMGILFLSAYIFRKQLQSFFENMFCEPLLQQTETLEDDNPFINSDDPAVESGY